MAQRDPRTLDAAFASFWYAPAPAAARDAVARVVAATRDFQLIYTRLRAGRPYTTGRLDALTAPPLFFAPAATVSKARRNALGLWHPYLYVVPPSYDPTRKYPVRFYLQGDTSQPASSAESGFGRWLNYEALVRKDSIVVFPGAWNGFPWWGYTEVEHMQAVLDELKRAYNVDENRVYLLGSSDGGTGVYYHAMTGTTPWAGFLPFNADPAVLGYPEAGVDTQLSAANLANKPFFVVHGRRDLIYPVAGIESWLRLFESAGAQITFRLKERFGHETRWWAEEEPAMDAFIAAHPRNPLPDRVTWETSDTTRYNRAHWVVIDELGTAVNETAFATPDQLEPTPPGFGVGIWSDVEGGVRIALVQPGSVADEHGLRQGDLIQEVEDVRTTRFEQIDELLRARAGKAIQVRILRDGTSLTRFISLPAVPPAPVAAFPQTKAMGRIDVERRGNDVDVRTRGVKRFTLLLSPDQFDLSRPIAVTANGARVFDQMLAPSPEVLLEWAARDNDRTMLFAQQIVITLP